MSHEAHITWDDLFAIAWRHLETDGWLEPGTPESTGADPPARGAATVSTAVMAHVDGCEQCRARLDDMMRFARGLVVAGDVAPDVTTINSALAELRRTRRSGSDATTATGAVSSLGSRVKEELRDLVAVLVADSLRPSAAVRGQASANIRLLVFNTDTVAISVSADQDADRCVLRGQVTPQADADLPSRRMVAVAIGSTRPIEADLNEFGEFVLDDLPWGEFRLTFTLGSDRIHIPTFRIDEHD